MVRVEGGAGERGLTDVAGCVEAAGDVVVEFFGEDRGEDVV